MKLPFSVSKLSSFQQIGGIPRNVVIGLVLLLLFTGLGWGCLRLLNPPQVAEVAAVRKGKATAAVYGTLLVQPEQQILIKSRTNGVILALPHTVGQTVKQGEIVAEVGDEQQVSELQQTEVKLRTAKERLAIGPSSTNELSSRKNELERLAPLVADKTISTLEFERIKSVVQDLERRVAQENLALEQEVSLTNKLLENIRDRINQSTVRSPLDGVVLDLSVRLGETITNNTSIALIGSARCNLLASVNEEDVGMIRPGMTTLVRLYSFGNQTFNAEAVQVLPKAENQTYGVLLRLKDSQQGFALLPGMTGEANIVIGQRNDALIVPSRGVREGSRVLVVKNGRVEVRNVKTGFRSVEECEILGGLQEGELVIVSEQDRFSAGEKVKVQRWVPRSQ